MNYKTADKHVSNCQWEKKNICKFYHRRLKLKNAVMLKPLNIRSPWEKI